MNYRIVIDGLKLVGWSEEEVARFIEKYPRVWLHCLRSNSLKEAVEDIEVFSAYLGRNAVESVQNVHPSQ